MAPHHACPAIHPRADRNPAETNNLDAVRALLEAQHPADIADLLELLSDEQRGEFSPAPTGYRF
jgi:Mg/Co/Ni transporter MgtE